MEGDPESSAPETESSREEEPAGPAPIPDRMKQKQLLAVEELVSTERNYLNMLQLCTLDIRSSLQLKQLPSVDLAGLFANIADVIDISIRLLSLLERTAHTDPQFLGCIGEAFLGLREDLESVYKEYCASYTNTLALESSYKQSEGLWQEIIQTIKTVAPHTNASSLSFFMVMPVQRIARYPLLLQNVLKNTEPSHPSYQRLQEAATATVELNVHINEYKRLKEVADKYKKMESLTIMDRLCRINKHSIAKKTARLSQMMKHEAGIVPKTEDKEFDVLEEYMCVLEKGVADLQENVAVYLKHLEDFLRSRPHERDLDIENEEAVRCYKEISEAMHQWIYPTFRRRLEALVFRPLCTLRELMAGPRNLIRKRLHKLLDFEQIEEKRRSGSVSYEEQEVANTYQALNALLLSELPRLNATGTQLLLNTLGAFSCIQRDLAAEVERLSQGYLQQLPHSHLPPSAFWRWVGDAIQEGTQKVQSASQSIGEHLNTPIAMPLSPSSQQRLRALSLKYRPEQIYQVSSNVGGSRELDLTLPRGELVGVLQEMDTRGDQHRWLVEAGGRRGYVPAGKLKPYHQVALAPSLSPSPSRSRSPSLSISLSQFPSSQYLSPVVGGAECRRHSYTEMTVTDRTTAPPCFQILRLSPLVSAVNPNVAAPRSSDSVLCPLVSAVNPNVANPDPQTQSSGECCEPQCTQILRLSPLVSAVNPNVAAPRSQTQSSGGAVKMTQILRLSPLVSARTPTSLHPDPQTQSSDPQTQSSGECCEPQRRCTQILRLSPLVSAVNPNVAAPRSSDSVLSAVNPNIAAPRSSDSVLSAVNPNIAAPRSSDSVLSAVNPNIAAPRSSDSVLSAVS
ncbi:rho guanine nucleotide exchange factor 37-like isoform X2 [Huso huso]|uniref:Rho guanine nucleotide exchange factor 37-like isoform X2 n=1 Tax=Huso huso TaxID=61971 RepID=A0ABR0YSS9_HUSHU